MIGTLVVFGAGVYVGGALVTFAIVGGGLMNRVISAALWPTFPFWPG